MEPDLADILKKANRLLFIGVGNVLKSDDGVGVVISRQIEERGNIRALTVEVSIENYIGKINSMEPGEIVILDCMELASNPGSYRIMALDHVEDITFNTHNISLGRLEDFFDYPTYVLGIQPRTLAFGDELSPPVKKAATQIISQINQKNN
ncbi:MAG: hydrogenase maturation protease [Bacteroidales bacterium]|nr:hydrogenase maturation protease [Bacteroidales bacterium]